MNRKQTPGIGQFILLTAAGIFLRVAVFVFLVLIIPLDDEGEETHSFSDIEATGTATEVELADNRVSVNNEAKSATIMIYMNGSDLESEDGQASTDISEMLASGIGENVNVIIQTMGTKEWHDYGIASDRSQRYKITNGELELIRDDLGQLDCTQKDTLSDFIWECTNDYPAERYILLFWNHGGGPVYGFGYDEWQSEYESLTLAEITDALGENTNTHFDIIGMDCCIMANIETCYAIAPYCDYSVLSEDFESGLGWSYEGWMSELENDPGIDTSMLGKSIVDSAVAANEDDYYYGDTTCIGLFNEELVVDLFSAWKNYAYQNEETLLSTDYSRIHESKGKTFFDTWESDESYVTLSDYYISDILAIVESVDSESQAAQDLISALKATVTYYGHTSDKNELTGLAVSLPYGDYYFYDVLQSVYADIGIDAEYIEWLGGFVEADGYGDYYDYGTFDDEWGGWQDYEEDYGLSDGSINNSYIESDDEWTYDYEEELWYKIEGDTLFMYDDETGLFFYYDEQSDEIYYYDEYDEEWYLIEE